MNGKGQSDEPSQHDPANKAERRGSTPRGNVESSWQPVLICSALIALVAIVFGQTAQFQFVELDDGDYVFLNPFVMAGLTKRGIRWAFTNFHSSNWHPLTWISHMVDCQFFGLHAGGHHLTNVIIHGAVAVGLFIVLRRLTGCLWGSAFVAAVFAIHPLRAESVAWVAERKDVLSGLFFVLVLGAYHRYVREGKGPKLYANMAALFALGLMCKPMLVTVPLVLLVVDFWPLRREERWTKLVAEKVPLLALSAASSVVTMMAQRGVMLEATTLTPLQRAANACLTVVVYLRQMVWPTRLTPYYPYLHQLNVWRIGLAILLALGWSVLAWRERKRQPWLLAGWLWYLIMLLPVIGLVQVGIQAHADRYTYLPQIGIYISLAWAAAGWRVPKIILAGAAVAVVAVLSVCAAVQTSYWRNSETMATRTLQFTADNFIAQTILGNALLKRGDFNEAIVHFKEAMRINPAYTQARNNYGNALVGLNRIDEASAVFADVLRLDPGCADAYYNLGNIYLNQGKTNEAIAELGKAVEIRPAYPAARNNLGVALWKSGKLDEAVAQFRQALEIYPLFVDAWNNMGTALLEMGDANGAIEAYKKALAIDPQYQRAQDNLQKAILQQ